MEQYRSEMCALNTQIWDFSELKFEEHRSAQAMRTLLEQHGFEVRAGVAEMPTAFTASYGSGGPVIGILAEFDALSGMSQQADLDTPSKRPQTACGHGCGHNLLGTAAVWAALGVRDYLRESGKPGTVVLAGCPAEEGGSGKAYMARAGVFDSWDLALTWHPSGGNAVGTGSMQANCQVYFEFTGVSAHAAGCPHLGRSALDAVELMNVGVNYMREHMETTDRIHYAVLDTGGTSPNVVQGHAKSVYLIRSVDSEKVSRLYERVCKIAQGAALMTETQVKITFDKACSNILSNSVLEQVLYDAMTRIGPPAYTEEDYAYARRFKKTITKEDVMSEMSIQFLEPSRRRAYGEKLMEAELSAFIIEHRHADLLIPGSSDVGDVSHTVPTAQFVAACFVPGTPAHSWQMVAQGKSSIAEKGMEFAACVLRTAAVEILEHPELAARAKEEFMRETGGTGYACPIPGDIHPNGGAAK